MIILHNPTVYQNAVLYEYGTDGDVKFSIVIPTLLQFVKMQYFIQIGCHFCNVQFNVLIPYNTTICQIAVLYPNWMLYL